MEQMLRKTPWLLASGFVFSFIANFPLLIFCFKITVGEPTMEVEGIAEITTTPDGKMATMEINGNAAEGDTASFTYGKQPLAKPVCIPEGKGVPIPTAWEVVNQESELKDLYLFVFNLLPQKSTREYVDADAEGISKVSESPPAATKMPTCKGEMLSFHFVSF
jgi:hypothetical protein